MILIVCVDDEMGMAFYGRRQSRDRAVCSDIAAIACGQTVWMDECSVKLFEGLDGTFRSGVEQAGKGEFCFMEFAPAEGLAERAEKLILYRWNRRYPADLYFRVPLEKWSRVEVAEFQGHSHELITREVYIHENQ